MRLIIEILEGLGKVQEDILGSPVLSLLISCVITSAGISISFDFLGWFGDVLGYASIIIGIIGIIVSLKRLIK